MEEPQAPDGGVTQIPAEEVNEVILCTVGKESFAIPLDALAEIYRGVEITPLPLAPDFLTGVINVHGNLSSVLSLAAILNADQPSGEGLLLILTPEYGGIALLVDGTTGFTFYSTLEEVAVDDAVGEGSVQFIEGVFRDDGNLVTLINPEKLRVWIDNEFVKGEN
jgi:purine-binding chemotaxis protein CheW